MAYGLQIDNGSGQRTVDSEYSGIYYIGKDTASGPGQLSVSDYTNSVVPPIVCLKLPTSGTEFCSMTSLTFSAPGPVGGAATVSLAVPANTVIVFAPAQEQTACENLGGVFFNDGIGGCRLTGTIQFPTDLTNTTRSATVSLTCTAGVINAGATAVINAGYGWSVSDTSPLDSVPSRGWHTFDTGTQLPVDESVLVITIDSLANGWVAQLDGDFTDTVTGYFYGVGGSQGATNELGLELRDSSGDITFSSNRPPPTIRDIVNISFTGLTYATGWLFVGAPPAGSASTCNEVLSFPTATTAMYSLPIMPTTLSTGGSIPNVPAVGLGTNLMGDYVAGLRFNTSGGNIVSIGEQSKQGSTIQVSVATCGDPHAMVLHSPFWNITSGDIDPVRTLQTCTGALGLQPEWDVDQDCIFIDTTIPDALPY